MVEVFMNAKGFLFRRGRVQVGSMPFTTLEVEVAEAATESDKREMDYLSGEFVPGEVFKVGKGKVVLGPPREFTHEVELRAAGNPDFQQYADIGPRKTVRCCSTGEAAEITRRYQERYEMGMGNCSKEHGRVWLLPAGGKGRRKRVGQVWYNGKFRTNAQIAEFEAEMARKYPSHR